MWTKGIKTISLALVSLVLGCPMIEQEQSTLDLPLLVAPPSQVFSINGTWWLDYTDSPNPTCLVFTNRRITAEFPNCVDDSVTVLESSRAQVIGNTVSFSYRSTQTVFTPSLGLLSGDVTVLFDGVISPDGSISGTAHSAGTVNGVFLEDDDAFVMFRI